MAELHNNLANGYPCEIITIYEAIGRFEGIPYAQILTGFEIIDVDKGTMEFIPAPLPSPEPE